MPPPAPRPRTARRARARAGARSRARAGRGPQLRQPSAGADPPLLLGDERHAAGVGAQLVGPAGPARHRRGVEVGVDGHRHVAGRAALDRLGEHRPLRAGGALDQHRPARGQHHLGVAGAVADPERVERPLDVRDDDVLLGPASRQQVLVVRHPAGAGHLQPRVAPHLGDVVDPVPADRVDEVLPPAKELLHEQRVVAALQLVGAVELGGERAPQLGGAVAEDDAVGAGAVDRLDDDRPVAAVARPRDRRLDVVGLELGDRVEAGGAQRAGHRVLAAARPAERGAVAGQPERRRQRVGQRHADLGAGDHRRHVPARQRGDRRRHVAVVAHVGDVVLGAERAREERRRPGDAADVDELDPALAQPPADRGPGRVRVDDDERAGHARATRMRRSSGVRGRPSKPP